MARRIRKLALAAALWDIHFAWLSWLIRRAENQEPRWKFWWAWFIYQVVSGYPPGELAEWDEYPPWLAKVEPWLVPVLHTRGDPEQEKQLREYWALYDA